MTKIEKIAKEMNKMIAKHNLTFETVIDVLFNNIDYGVETGKWEYCPMNVSEMRDVLGKPTWRQLESIFHGLVLDKNTIREFFNNMDGDNQAYFVWEIWRDILCDRFIGDFYKNERKNWVILFETEDLMNEFEDVLVEIKNHTN